MPSEQAAHSLQQSARRKSIIAYRDTLASHEVSRSVVVGFLAVNVPYIAVLDIRKSMSHFLWN
ncbi:hypothetical protein ABH939_006328 [Rhodococcus sp. 27YEA6]